MLLKILPLKVEYEKGNKWVQTDFSLSLKILKTELIIHPIKKRRILYSNLVQLLEGVRQFIERQRSYPEDIDVIGNNVKPFEFVPLELDFEFSCLGGDISSNAEEGEVTLQIMANLGLINQSLSSEYVGCITNIDIKTDLISFLDNLEKEL